MKHAISLLFGLALAFRAMAQSDETYQGTFDHHTVRVSVFGLCQSPDLAFTNTYQQSSISVPLDFEAALCTGIGFEGALDINFPDTTPVATIVSQTLRFNPPWALNVTASGDWAFPGEPINNPRELIAQMTLDGQQTNFTFCAEVRQTHGPGIGPGSYPVSVQRDCPVAAITSPTQEGGDLLYDVPTYLNLTVFARSNAPNQRIIWGIAVEVHSYYRVNTTAGMHVTPASLEFNVVEGVPSKDITVQNTGSSNLNFTVSTGAANWLSVEPLGGTLAPQQTTNLAVSVDPILVPSGATNTGTITVSGNAENSPRIVTVRAVRAENHLEVRNPSPPSGTRLQPGTEVAFSVVVDYRLDSAETGDLILDALSAIGSEIASTGPHPISSSGSVLQTTLAMSPISIPLNVGSITLRVRLISGGVVLKEGIQVIAYPVGSTRTAGHFSVIDIRGDEFKAAEIVLPGDDASPLTVGMEVPVGARIITGLDTTVILATDDSQVVVKELTDFRVDELEETEDAVRTRLWLKAGEVSADILHRPLTLSDFAVRTPTATASVRGTVFTLRHDELPEPKASLFVTNGVVTFIPTNPNLPEISVTSNQVAQITETKVIAPGGPVITHLGAGSGLAGTQLTIFGEYFSPTPASNTVSFGGFHGTVVNATANQLTLMIPASLATAIEPVTVTVNGLTSNSTNFFVSAAQSATVVGGNVTGVWTHALSPYMISGNATVPAGGTLQIEPGVVVTMESIGARLFVPGSLIAEGTNGAPIRFTSVSTNKAPAQWGAVIIQDSSDDAQTRLADCTFEYGGYFQQGTLELHSASPRLKGITVRGSGANGLYLADSAPRMTNCVFIGNAGSAVLMDVASFPLLDGTFATGNGFNGVGAQSGVFVRSGTWINDGGLPYRIFADVEITSGNTLTIQPGTTVEFADLGGDLFVNGTLHAAGTPGELITFTADGTNTARGQWSAIVIGPSSTNTVLEHCIIERGGYFRNAAVEINGASATVRNCAIGSSAWHGLAMTGVSAAEITDCTFLNSAQSAISMTPHCFPVVANNSARDNGANSIAIQGGSVTNSGTWLRDTIPYSLQTDVTIASNAVLTIEAGTTVQIADISGDLIVDGALVARGAAASPIRFTTDDASPGPGRWGAILIRNSSVDALTALEHCIVEYGGYFRNASVEVTDASPSISQTTVRQSGWHGISLSASAARISECHFESNFVYAAAMDPASFPLVTNNTATGNGGNAIGVSGGTLANSGTWLRGGLPYTLMTDVTIATNRTLTIEPGNTVQFADLSGDLLVDGVLDARGTAAQPILFTSNKATKSPGQWAAIILRNGTTPSMFEHCTVEFGGYFRNASMELLGASPLISDCVFQWSSWDGLFAQNSSSVVQRSRFVNNAHDGLGVNGTAGFRVHNSVIAGNGAWGVRNATTQVIPAQSNYWGHASGPFDNANTDGLALLNPSGEGDPVSEYVQWSGFLTSAPAFTGGGELELAVERIAGDIILSWDANLSGVVLESIGAFGGSNVWTGAGLTATNANGRMRATLQPSSLSRLFRLRQLQ